MLYHSVLYLRWLLGPSFVCRCFEPKPVIYETSIFHEITLFWLDFAQHFTLGLEDASGCYPNCTGCSSSGALTVNSVGCSLVGLIFSMEYTVFQIQSHVAGWEVQRGLDGFLLVSWDECAGVSSVEGSTSGFWGCTTSCSKKVRLVHLERLRVVASKVEVLCRRIPAQHLVLRKFDSLELLRDKKVFGYAHLIWLNPRKHFRLFPQAELAQT